jgi:hypothetical protein
VGDCKHRKSTLINALVGAEVLPTGEPGHRPPLTQDRPLQSFPRRLVVAMGNDRDLSFEVRQISVEPQAEYGVITPST